MKRLCWRFVNVVSRLLESNERDAVLGDFAESGETAGQALRGLLGLVLRRQAALWNDWRVWLTVACLIVPLGMLLSIASKITADRNATYIWMYANNWDWNLLKYREFWYEFGDSVVFVFGTWVTLVCMSWSVGFVLGSVSRRIARIYGLLFCLVLAFGGLSGAPRYLAYLWHDRPGASHPHGPTSMEFYRSVFPLIVQAVLVAIPALWGMRQGKYAGQFQARLRIILWIAALGALAALVFQQPGFGLLLNASWRSWMPRIRLLNFIVYWPLAYFAVTRIWRVRHWSVAQ